VDSSVRPTPVDLVKVNENSATTVSEIVNDTDFAGDAWIRQRPQPLLTQKQSPTTESLQTQKSSPKRLPNVTCGFESARNPS
jgi:hypothetical protein